MRLFEELSASLKPELAGPGTGPGRALGMRGRRGAAAAVGALTGADRMSTLGARCDDRVTGKLDSFAPDAKVIHADIDPAEISKNRLADVPIVGDLAEVIKDLNLTDLPEFNAALREFSPLSTLRTIGILKDPMSMTLEERVLAAYYERLPAFAIDKSPVLPTAFPPPDPALAARGPNLHADR